MTIENPFIHQVYFWLKDPSDKVVAERFEAALRRLVTIDTIQEWFLGEPASTRRDVIESSYNYSLLTLFRDQASHDAYQVHPVHDDFRLVVDELCSMVQVFDSIPFEQKV